MRFSSRFSLRKTLTIFSFHRRTKSDTAVIINPHVASTLPQSNSDPVLDIRPGAFEIAVPSSPPDSLKVPSTPNNAIRTTLPYTSNPVAGPPTLELTIIRQRITQLEADNATLSEQISSLLFEVSLREEELTKMRGELLNEKLLNYTQKRAAEEEAAKYEAQNRRIIQLDKFIAAMIDIGLNAPVLEKAKKAVLAGELADDALVDAIKEAAAKPGTAWARIMPAIVGPRTPDNYVSAINLALKTRQELRCAQKITKFWKKKALLDLAHGGTVTPSPSQLSDVVIRLTDERQCAVDELLRKMKNGELLLGRVLPPNETTLGCSPLCISAAMQSQVDSVHSGSTSTERPSITCTSLLPTPADSSPSPGLLATQSTTPGEAASAQSSLTDPDMKAKLNTTSALLPVNIQGMKDALSADQSIKRPPSISTLKPRAILGNIDMNRGIPSLSSTSSSSSRASKRQGLILSATRTTTSESETAFDSLEMQMHRSTTSPEYNSLTPLSDPIRSPSLGIPSFSDQAQDLSFNVVLPSLDQGKLAAERALQSLERICAAFSSGSLGSLDTIGEEGSSSTGCAAQLRSLSSGPHTVTTDSTSNSGTLHSEPPQVADVVPPPYQAVTPETKRASPVTIKRSMLPVFKGFRRLSVSISPPRRSVIIPTANNGLTSSGQKNTKSTVLLTKSTSPTSTLTTSIAPKKIVKKTSFTSSSPTSLASTTRSSTPPTPPSKIPALVKTTPNKRIMDRGRRAVKSLSRILS
ncbi:hypothetical protein AX16_006869 [Volvariella volvacea WC 439]|nr:hypothetical protein AX16_006869 [Volvariella volvacea WC 439]